MKPRVGPRAWTLALRRQAKAVHCVLREEPPSRWPLAWHLLLASGLALAAVAAAAAWDTHLSRQQQHALAAVRQAKGQLRQASAQPARQATDAPLPLLERARLVQVVADFGQLAAARTVRPSSLQIQYGKPAAGIQHVRCTLSVRGDYPAIKSWLGELLARYPALALHSLQLRASEERGLEAALALDLYLRSAS